MRRLASFAFFAILVLTSASSSSAPDADPALKDAESLYRQEGPEIALPIFEGLAEKFNTENKEFDEATAVHFIGTCQWRLGNFAESREHLNLAFAMRESLGDENGVAKTSIVLGLLEWDLGNYDQAIARFRAASAAGKAIGDRKIEGAALNNISLVYDELGDYQTSLAQYQEVLEIYAGADFPRGEGDTYGNIGGVYLLLGQFRTALSYYEKALAVSTALSSKMSMSQDHGNIGLARLGLGDVDIAIQNFDAAIELAGETGMRQDAAYWSGAKANALIQKGRFDTGLEIHRRTLDDYEEIGAQGELLVALHDMGRLHLSLGDAASAESYFKQAISLARKIGNANGITINLLALGELYLRRDQLDAASSHFNQARRRASQAETQALLVESVLGLAYVHHEQMRFDEAADELNTALAISREIESRPQEGEALFVLAENQRRTKNVEQALELFSAAESVFGDSGDPDMLWQIHFGRARSLESLGDKHGAIESLRQSVLLIEGVRSRLREERFRSGYLQDKQQVYVELVRLQLEMDMTEEAFETAERLRVRSFSQQFERMGYPLLTKEQQRREQELRERVRQLQRALGEEQASPENRQLAVQTFSTELILAEREYQAFLDDHVQLAARRTEVQPSSGTAEVRQQLADGDVLIEYVVGENEVMIFAINSREIFATIEPVRQVDLSARVELLRDLISRPGDSRWQKPAANLAKTLLEPLAQSGSLDAISNLYIVPHGVLNYLPFAVLPIEIADDQKLLLDEYTLAYLPTAVALGGPIDKHPNSASLLAMAPGNSRLRYAPDEARSINALFEPNSRLLLGSAATESLFKTFAGDYRMLHLATHSDFNKLNPMFSSLQLEADDHNDGRLEVHEVLRLNLHAELVTLSACDTALGSGFFAEVPAGDEFVGLTRAFLSVGSDSVMATLWEVDDRSSVQLMQQFYERLDSRGENADKSAALMLAQQQLRSTKGYEHPYYWAPFVLVGKMSNASETRTQVPEATL